MANLSLFEVWGILLWFQELIQKMIRKGRVEDDDRGCVRFEFSMGQWKVGDLGSTWTERKDDGSVYGEEEPYGEE